MQALIDREELALPWRHNGLELLRYGGVMLQLKSDHGYVLTFTPQSNEFTISLLSSSTTGHTAGLCGNGSPPPFLSYFFVLSQLQYCLFLVMSDCSLFLSSRCLWGGEG